MYITKNTIDLIINKERRNKSEIKTLNLNRMNTINFSLSEVTFKSIEYLSLQNNLLKNTSFLKYFPNLWYLDIRSNQIENYDGLVKHGNFGYLALTLEIYNSYEFFKIKNLNVAILTLEGLNEEDERLNLFLYHSDNNVLKLNKNMLILDYDKKYTNLEAFFYNAENDKPELPFREKESKLNLINHLKIFGDKERNSPKKENPKKKFNLNLKNFFDNFNKNAKEVFLELIQDKMKQKPPPKTIQRHETLKMERNKQSIRKDSIARFNKEYRKPIHSRTIKIFHQNFDLGDVNFKEKEEVINLERQKIIYMAKIFSSIVDLQREIKNDKKVSDEEKVFISYDCLLVNDPHLLTIIIDILILYILGVFHKEISRRLLKNVLHKVYHNHNTNFSFNLKKLFESESCYILGIYFRLCDHLFKIVSQSDLATFDDYKMLKLIPELNNLQKLKEKSYEINQNKNESIYEVRRLEINNSLIKFYEETKIFESIVKITQHINDYILINKLEKELVLETYAQYKVFLELRNIFFSHLNKKSETSVIFGTLSDKIHNQFKSENLTNVVFFLHQDAIKQKKNDLTDEKSEKKLKKLELNNFRKRLKKFEEKYESSKNLKPIIAKPEENIFISQNSNFSEISSRNEKNGKKSFNYSLPEIKQSKFNTMLSKNSINNLSDLKLNLDYNLYISSKSKALKTSNNKEFLKMMNNLEINRKKEKQFLSDQRLVNDKLRSSMQSKETNTMDHSIKNIKNNFFTIRYDSDKSSEFSKNFIKRGSPKNGIFKQFYRKSLKKLNGSNEKKNSLLQSPTIVTPVFVMNNFSNPNNFFSTN